LRRCERGGGFKAGGAAKGRPDAWEYMLVGLVISYSAGGMKGRGEEKPPLQKLVDGAGVSYNGCHVTYCS
jgi:hypothetical protein